VIRVNGMATDVVPATDRGLAYGDGVFRTLAVRAGRAAHWDRQYAKLALDCRRLGIECPPADILHADMVGVTRGEADAAVKIIVTRGASERGYRMPRQSRPTRVVISSPLPAYPGCYASEGIAAYLCEMRLGTQPALAGVKHLNRLENILARAEWGDDTYAEGIMRDGNGNVIGGTMTNIFIVEGGRLVTPELSHCGVAGVTRDRIFDWCGRERIQCAVETIALDRALVADEVFLVNSLVGVWPVRSIGESAVRTGSVAQRISASLDETHSTR